MSEVGIHHDFLGCFGLLKREGAWLLVGNHRELSVGAPPTLVFDLPGGRVEAGETLEETLIREWHEECCLEIEVGPFAFVQEGVRVVGGQRRYAWRSFFFEVSCVGEPKAASEIKSLLWCPEPRLAEILQAPYHQGFVRYLAGEGRSRYEFDTWEAQGDDYGMRTPR